MSANYTREKCYLGDAVYAAFDGFNIVLTTEDGVSATNVICIEPEVLDALNEYAARIKAKYENKTPNQG